MYQTDVSRLTASGNGTAVEFPVAMPLYDVTHLQVWEYVAATGVLTLLTRGTNYTLSLYADYSGGMVQFVHDPGGGSVVYAPATGTSFVFLRVVPFTQDTNLRNWGKNDQEALERQIDLAFMAISQLAEVVERCAQLDVTYGPGSGASFLESITAQVTLAIAARVAAESAAATATTQAGLAEAAAASIPTFGAFGETLAATAAASDARTALGLGTAALVDTGTAEGDVVVFGTSASLVAPALLDISGASAGQIKFPAVMNPSANANTLDDYEQGTFVPTVDGSMSAGTGTYSVQLGRYTKVGRLVHVSILLTWSAHNGTGNMRISGLPFATGMSHGIPVAYATDITIAGVPVALVSGAASVIAIYAMNNGASHPLAIDTAATMYFNFCYYTA